MLEIAALIVTVVAGLLLVRYHDVVFTKSLARHDNRARQASHTGEPLRFGGLVVFIGIFCGLFILPDRVVKHTGLFVFASALPVFVVGLIEDMGHAMSPLRRLGAAAISACLAMFLLGAWVPRADLVFFDGLMSFHLVAVSLTILFSAGFCHAVNLIDGMNGLAALNAIMSALGLAVIAHVSGQAELASFALLIAACLAGFLVFNWPSAVLFLGDAGAYGIGHLLTWISVLLLDRYSDLAVPAVLLVLFWPLADVFHTIFRRIVARQAPFQPDRMHLHHKVRRSLDLIFFGYNARSISNPLTTIVLAPFIALPVVTGVLLSGQPTWAWGALMMYLLAFAGAHKLLPRLAVRYRSGYLRQRRIN